MGLDMYLEKKNINSTEDESYYEVAYWRKANQIRQWFDTHIDGGIENCKRVAVTCELLEELIADCDTVLQNKNLAEEILPTSDGFFFGSTDYNEYYFEELNETKERLGNVIIDTDWEKEEVCYYESW